MGSETAKKRSFVEVAEGRYQSTDAGMEEEVGIDGSGPQRQDQFEANLRWICFLFSIGFSFVK